jgi:hypothetical protein
MLCRKVGDHHGQGTGLKCNLDSSRKKWTFGSGLLLYQRYRKRREESAWKRRKIETSLVIVRVVLHVLTYVVSYKLFWNWIGVVRFVFQEVWFNKGFVIWHFLSYYWEQIVSLWSLSIEVRIILTTNDRVDRIRYLKSTASQNDIKMNFYETMRRRPDFCMQQKCTAGETHNQNSPQDRFFDSILVNSQSYWYSLSM